MTQPLVSYITGPGSLFIVTGFTGFHRQLFAGVPHLRGQMKLLPVETNIALPQRPIPSEAELHMFNLKNAKVTCNHVTLIDGNCNGDYCNGVNLFDGDKVTPENCSCFSKAPGGNRTFVVLQLDIEVEGKTYHFDNVINKEFQQRYILKDEPSSGMYSAKSVQGSFVTNSIKARCDQVFSAIELWNIIGWAKPGLVEDALEKESSQKAPNGTKSSSEANSGLLSSSINYHLVSMRPAIFQGTLMTSAAMREIVEPLINDKLKLSELVDEHHRQLEAFALPDEEDVFFAE
jgi:hypothetical protein